MDKEKDGQGKHQTGQKEKQADQNGSQTGGQDRGRAGARQPAVSWWRRTTSLPSSLNRRKHPFLQVSKDFGTFHADFGPLW